MSEDESKMNEEIRTDESGLGFEPAYLPSFHFTSSFTEFAKDTWKEITANLETSLFRSRTHRWNANQRVIEMAKHYHWTDRQLINALQIIYANVYAQFDEDDHCVTLTCPETDLIELPEKMPYLKLLDITRCTSLRNLPEMPRIETLFMAGATLALPADYVPHLHGYRCMVDPAVDLPEMPALRRLDCTGCLRLTAPDNYLSEQSRSWIQPWQERGLMPLDPDKGILVWKHVSPALRGNLGYEYRLGRIFNNTGMACAGPFGALRKYDKYPLSGSRVMAIWATCLYPVNIHEGVYHILRGTPAAVFLAKDPTEEGFTPVFLSGTSDAHIERVLYGEES